MRTRLGALLTLAALTALVAPAAATPVKCKGGDVTVGDRIFPEPEFSTQFVRFDEFECAVALMERTFPNAVEVTTIGTSKGGHRIYDVLLTDETVAAPKEKLLVMSSIHGDEIAGREGAVRTMEDLLDGRFLANEDWVKKVLDEYVIHFVFPNPDGWVAGDLVGTPGAGAMSTRGNGAGRDLNRQMPVVGFIDQANQPFTQPEAVALRDLFHSGDWYLGTDNHGQLADTYAAAGLQIVGEFDYQKSETIARFGNGINETMEEYEFGTALGALQDQTGQDLGPYHWGTLYDMLGYSASGSGIDYYNTPGLVDGTGFATEMTVGKYVAGGSWASYPVALNNVWVDGIRAINVTMFRQAVDRKVFRFPVGSDAAYVFDPKVVTSADGPGTKVAGVTQAPYSVTRMKFFEDLNGDATTPLRRLPAAALNGQALDTVESLVLANGPLPADPGFYDTLEAFVRGGGNLILTDAAARALGEMGVIASSKIAMHKAYVGYVDFSNRTDPLNQNLRGVASQTYDTVPIGYRFPAFSAPNWTVEQAAWEAAGGRTAATTGTGRTSYGELPLGKGKIRFLGALLPDPTEEFDHRYGLQNYAVTYTGYTLLENMLRYERPAS